MTHRIFSPNGTPVGRFAFGTMQFGEGATAQDSAEMFEACRGAGINHFDTAHLYTSGKSEEILGGLIRDCRDALVIATKVGYNGGAGRANLAAQFDLSRQRLQLDQIDILYLHRFDADTPLEETLDFFAEQKAQGNIRYVGLSNFAAWQVVKAAWLGAAHGVSIDVLQPMYNLVKRQAEVEILPMCADLGILAATYSPLGGGLLTGKYSAPDGTGRLRSDRGYAARYGVDWMHTAATELASTAADMGVSPATLAVAWAARHSAAPSPILSARTAAQLAPSLAAVTFDMDDALYAQLTALTPTPPPATDRLEEA
ncbi:aldo/keto reductase [Shimia sp. MMG029]|uniref:aldo/keto reductase n=1 Tax=Shimia sp. MMG029 TaxID=3021978 RepID=UPI0022FEC6D3|nr:aldo/keto reductase [Shimia sp. MMG029]MDA5556591.1 aldo/keto reductase [Shimia sp. MMG029]